MPKQAKARKITPSVVPNKAIAAEIARIIDERDMTQTEASYVTKEAPSQISLIVTGKLRGFSFDRLVRVITGLGRDVEVRIVESKSKTGKVRLKIQ